MFVEIWSSLAEAFAFCWSLLADEHNTLPKSTRRHVKLDKFVFGTIYYVSTGLRHQYGISVAESQTFLRAKRPKRRRARRNECFRRLSSLPSSSHRQPKGVAWHRWRNTCANDCFTQVTSFIADNTRFFPCTWAACVTTRHSYLHVKEIFFSKIEIFLSANMHDLNNYQKDLKKIFKHSF